MKTFRCQIMKVIFNEGQKRSSLKFSDDKRHNELSPKAINLEMS